MNVKLTEQDLVNASSIVCDECGNNAFNSVYLIKHISALISPTGQEINAPFPTFACTKCGHINDQFLPPSDRQPRG